MRAKLETKTILFMKTIFTKFLLCIGLFFILANANAQNGLQCVYVEKYYVSNVADSIGSVGILPVGSITYRVFADMLPGYKFQMAYGSPTHLLTINTTTSFFNNEDRGATNPTYTKAQAKNNTVMLDSGRQLELPVSVILEFLKLKTMVLQLL